MIGFQLLCAAALLAPITAMNVPFVHPPPTPDAGNFRQQRNDNRAAAQERAERRAANLAAQAAREADAGCCQNVGNCLLGTCNLLVCTPAQQCAGCVAGTCTAGCAAAGRCCSASCGLARACCGQVAACCSGCWMLVPTCQQCIVGTRQCVDCTCGAVVFVTNGVNDNCIQPCCVEALYRGCLQPFARGDWVQPCNQCVVSSARCVGTGCRDGAVCVATGCADCTVATGQCIATTAGDCGRGCATCTAECRRACAQGCADCAQGCSDCARATGACIRAFPWGMRCFTVAELRMFANCLGDAGMACLMGTRTCASAAGSCVRDEVCCYQQWPTLEQIRTGCAGCVDGCTTCVGDCGRCVDGCARDCVTCTARCAGDCADGCYDCIVSIPQCTRDCAAGCQRCLRECNECCTECCQGCNECCTACCDDLSRQGRACLAETSRQGALCWANTRDGCHHTVCVSLPSRLAGAQARASVALHVTAPSVLESANRGAQRANTAGAIMGARAGLFVSGPRSRAVRLAREYADAHPADADAQITARDLEERRVDREALRAARTRARHAWRQERLQLLPRFRENNQIRYLERYYRHMDAFMGARGWVGEEGSGAPYPLYSTRLANVHQQRTMTDEEFEAARHLLHTRGAQFERFLRITQDILDAQNADDVADAPGFMADAERSADPPTVPEETPEVDEEEVATCVHHD